MIKKLNFRQVIPKQDMGNLVISSTGKGEYFREITKKEIMEKVNELIDYLNGTGHKN